MLSDDEGAVSSARGNVIMKLCTNEPGLSRCQGWESTASDTHPALNNQLLNGYLVTLESASRDQQLTHIHVTLLCRNTSHIFLCFLF
jgi:hypothetical protein